MSKFGYTAFCFGSVPLPLEAWQLPSMPMSAVAFAKKGSGKEGFDRRQPHAADQGISAASRCLDFIDLQRTRRNEVATATPGIGI